MDIFPVSLMLLAEILGDQGDCHKEILEWNAKNYLVIYIP